MNSRYVLWIALAASCAHAATVTLTDAAPSFTATAPGPCFPANWAGCGTTAYLEYGNGINPNTTFTNVGSFHTIDGFPPPTGTESFLSGFNAFGDGWTLANGGNLALNLNISRFRAYASNFVGGVEIQIDVDPQGGYTGPPVADLFWIQSLLINYRASDPGNAMHHRLDEAGYNDLQGCTALPATPAGDDPYCGPIYPYQYSDRHFYDFPAGIYPLDSMRGIALLASVNAQSKVVTVYNGGVSYGYDVFVAEIPEPSTWWLCTAAVLLSIAYRKAFSAS